MKNLIYGLIDPFTYELRYIGKSTDGLNRPREHFKPYKVNLEKSHKNNWVKSCLKKGKKPLIEILSIVLDKQQIAQIEIKMIKQFRDLGFNLTNSTDGGEGGLGRKYSDETLKKMSISRKIGHKQGLYKNCSFNKKEHKEINGIKHKHCPDCNAWLPLDKFSSNSSRWDKLGTYCRQHSTERTYRNRNKKAPAF